MLGVCQGFSERNLDPELPEHQEVFFLVIEDVKGVFYKISSKAPDDEISISSGKSSISEPSGTTTWTGSLICLQNSINQEMF